MPSQVCRRPQAGESLVSVSSLSNLVRVRAGGRGQTSGLRELIGEGTSGYV